MSHPTDIPSQKGHDLMSDIINIEGHEVRITNPEKILWQDLGIRKIDYITYLIKISPYLLPHTKNRLLTTIRYPDGIEGKSFYQKNIPVYAPKWIKKVRWKNVNYILLNDKATLIWSGNQAALEFHTAFNLYMNEMYPTSLVFDLDPAKGQDFEQVAEIALLINDTLSSLNITSYLKTSGATGIQIYIPVGVRYDYDTARKINHFFGLYFSQKYPDKITIERMINKRGTKLYFDYLQMWHGKTITAVYSPRANKSANISMPLEWDELKKGIKPEDFTLLNAEKRLEEKGDLFAPLLDQQYQQNLDEILKFMN